MGVGTRMMMPVSAEKLLRDVRVVVQDAEDLIKATSNDAGERTREARARLAGALVVAKQSLGQAEVEARDLPADRRWFVRSYPFPSVGLALAVGIAFGVFLIRQLDAWEEAVLPGHRSPRIPGNSRFRQRR